MAQVIADPGEIRRFAHHLQQFIEELRDRMAVLHGRLVSLGDTWRDQEHERFTQDFEQTAHVLETFMANAGEYVPFLTRKAEKVENYLQQR